MVVIQDHIDVLWNLVVSVMVSIIMERYMCSKVRQLHPLTNYRNDMYNYILHKNAVLWEQQL